MSQKEFHQKKSGKKRTNLTHRSTLAKKSRKIGAMHEANPCRKENAKHRKLTLWTKNKMMNNKSESFKLSFSRFLGGKSSRLSSSNRQVATLCSSLASSLWTLG